MTRIKPSCGLLAVWLALGSTLACEKAESSTVEYEAPRKKKRRPTAKAETSGSVAAPLPDLPPVGSSVRTDPPPDLNAPVQAEVTASGLATKVLKRGTGTDRPTINDTVTVHYSGWTLDGRMFDSSVPRGKPASFGVGQVIKGWTEALQLMVEGERRRLWIPAELAYGNTPTRSGAPAGRLVFDVEVLSITRAPETPADLKAPPADATRTASGLVYKMLRRGSSNERPTETSKVTVHYSGWMLDGKMFDSSHTRGKPAKFGVSGVIKGWTEALQLMSPGDRMRVWIPGDLAYGDTPKRPGAPAGTLVFDIELIAIH